MVDTQRALTGGVDTHADVHVAGGDRPGSALITVRSGRVKSAHLNINLLVANIMKLLKIPSPKAIQTRKASAWNLVTKTTAVATDVQMAKSLHRSES
jgi:hypothetical protein